MGYKGGTQVSYKGTTGQVDYKGTSQVGYKGKILYLDSPFTVVDAFSLSYRFWSIFFTYSLTLYDGAIFFSDDY